MSCGSYLQSVDNFRKLLIILALGMDETNVIDTAG